MALTLYTLKRLRNAGLVGLFDKRRDLWKAKAQEAYNFTKKVVEPTGQRVRPDDVLPILQVSLEVSDELINFLAEARLGQEYWYQRFGALVLDHLWNELEGR